MTYSQSSLNECISSVPRTDCWSFARVSLNMEEDVRDFDYKLIEPAAISSELLEPRPVATNRMKIVHQVSMKNSSSFADNSIYQDPSMYESCILPLLALNGECKDPSSQKSRDLGMVSNTSPQAKLNFVVESSSGDLVEGSSVQSEEKTRKRESHVERWSHRFQELVEFQRSHGHCLVPLDWPHNPSLAHWVKRQRCQYKAMVEGNHSTLSTERYKALEGLGFIWDSHKATWYERLNEIKRFRKVHGHSNVPSRYPENPKLSIWVKCQRRQFKLYLENKKSNMTRERIECLGDVDFVWMPRSQKSPSPSPSKLERSTTGMEGL